jgi:ABC-type Fe3+/spermidine/putrescine transport system ATPase subunit
MLELRRVSKSFAGKPVLRDVSLQVEQGETVALLGPSGSGKSTLLAIIAGLETPDNGQVLWNGQDLAATPPHRRGFGLMFQDYALFPHRNVEGNVAFGLEMAGKSKSEIAAAVSAALERVGLAGYAQRDVHSLSGGEQQRVALARALAPQPRLLMLDEPLGSLDRSWRARLLADLGEILSRGEQSSLYVTHDQDEAYAIAQRVIILNAGQIAQAGTPQEIYRAPASAFVAGFLGLHNLFAAKLVNEEIETPLGTFPISSTPPPGPLTVLFRPDALRLDANGPATLRGRLLRTHFRGASQEVEIELPGGVLWLELPAGVQVPAAGEPVAVSFDPAQAIQVFPRE